jgi:hypothetical protein
MTAIGKQILTRQFDMNDTEEAWEIILLGSPAPTEVVFQFVQLSGTWGTAVLTLERSLDGINWVAMSSPTTYSAAGIQTGIDVTDIGHLRLRVSTAEGSAASVVCRALIKTELGG